MSRRSLREASILVALAAFTAACGGGAAHAQGLRVNVVQNAYGKLTVATAPGAQCTAAVQLPGDRAGSVHPLGSVVADSASGVAAWAYSTSPVRRGSGRHVITCGTGRGKATVSAPFVAQGEEKD